MKDIIYRRAAYTLLLSCILLGGSPVFCQPNIQGFPTGTLWIKNQRANLTSFSNSLVAFWTFDESNSPALDYTGHGFNATWVDPGASGTKFIPGPNNILSNALQTSSGFPVPAGATVSFQIDTRTSVSPWTMAGWFFNNGAGNNLQAIVSMQSSVTGIGNTNGWALYDANGNDTLIFQTVDDAGVVSTINAGRVAGGGVWQFYVFGYDGTNMFISISNQPPVTLAVDSVVRGKANLVFGNYADMSRNWNGFFDQWGYWCYYLPQAYWTILYATNQPNFGSTEHCAVDPLPCSTHPGPIVTYTGGILTITEGYPGYNSIYYTLDGTLPVYNPTLSGSTFQFTGGSFLRSNITQIIAVASVGCGCQGNCSLKDSKYTTNGPFNSLGTNWSANVVVNGGTAPANATVQAIDVWAGAMDDTATLFGGPPSIFEANIFAPDSLTAAITPIVYFGNAFQGAASYPLWTNHNFIAGDLSINGLTGNGTTKFLETAFTPNGHILGNFTLTDSGVAIYAYNKNTTATGTDLGCNDGAEDVALAGDFNSGAVHFLSDLIGASNGRLNSGALGNGFYAAERVSSASHAHYFGNSGAPLSAAQASNASASDGNTPNAEIYCFAYNNGGATQPANSTLSAAFITRGMNLTETSNLWFFTQALRTTLGGGAR